VVGIDERDTTILSIDDWAEGPSSFRPVGQRERRRRGGSIERERRLIRPLARAARPPARCTTRQITRAIHPVIY